MAQRDRNDHDGADQRDVNDEGDLDRHLTSNLVDFLGHLRLKASTIELGG